MIFIVIRNVLSLIVQLDRPLGRIKETLYVGRILMERNFPGLSSTLGMFFVFNPTGKQMK